MEMEEKLLTKRDLAAFFQTGIDAARRLCEKHGVLPINIGTGKTTRLRWRKSEVMQMLGTLEAGNNRRAGKDIIPRSRARGKTVVGKTVSQLMRELALPVQ